MRLSQYGLAVKSSLFLHLFSALMVFFCIESGKTFNMCISLLEIVGSVLFARDLQPVSVHFLRHYLSFRHYRCIFSHLILPASHYTLPISSQALGRYQNLIVCKASYALSLPVMICESSACHCLPYGPK
jgi:hypothetical protein